MGFWSNLKAKREHKSAVRQFEVDHADWTKDVEIFNTIRDAFELAAKGEDAVSNLTVRFPNDPLSITATLVCTSLPSMGNLPLHKGITLHF